MNSRRQFLKNLTGAAAVFAIAPSLLSKPDKQPPNFIFILTDDQGWTGTSASMHPVRPDAVSDYYMTPNIKKLAQQGMRFSNGYCPAAICCPTRRSLQFGQTPVRQGDDARFAENYAPGNDRLTIPRLLKSVDSRYRSAHFGKWDLRTELVPQDIGYDDSDGNTRNTHGNIGSPYTKETKWKKWVKYWTLNDPKRIDTLTTRANDFMERQVREKRPFYLQLSHYAVHVVMQCKEETLRKNADRPLGNRHRNIPFAAMTEDLDTGVGHLLNKVEELGISDHTYIFYMADNGAVGWFPPTAVNKLSHHDDVNVPSQNFPLRGGKWTLFEGGIRVPFIVKGPGIEPGSFSKEPVAGYDILPTIADLAGYQNKLPDDLDGVSFKLLLDKKGDGEFLRPNGLVFHRFANYYLHSAIRDGRYKLLRFWNMKGHYQDTPFWKQGKRVLLFDLEADLGETRDLSDSMPDKVAELNDKLMNYLNSVDAEVLKKFG